MKRRIAGTIDDEVETTTTAEIQAENQILVKLSGDVVGLSIERQAENLVDTWDEMALADAEGIYIIPWPGNYRLVNPAVGGAESIDYVVLTI